MEIKERKDGHDEKLAKLLRNYWETRDMDYSQEWTKEYIREGHRNEIIEDKFFVAEEGDEVVGSLSVILWEGGVAELRDFFVKEGYRKEGAGKKLFEKAYEFCRGRNARKIHAKIFPYLWDFFRKQEFKAEGILHDHFKEGEDLIVVGKFLSQS